MNHTTNLHLPQWEETDRIQMDDFNEAMAAIDAAMPRIVTGSYVGTGEYGENQPTTITTGFPAKLLIVIAPSNVQTQHSLIAVRGMTGVHSSYSNTDNAYDRTYLIWNDTSVSMYCDTGTHNVSGVTQFNASGAEYHYIAIG